MALNLLTDLVELFQDDSSFKKRISASLNSSLSAISFSTLPSDLICHILSFNSYPYNLAINVVNKEWNFHSKQIEKMLRVQRENAVNEYVIRRNEDVNNVLVVDPNRIYLTRDELSRNYQGPILDIKTAIQRCENGDRILVHDGVYKNQHIGEYIDKSIEIIGIGDNVIVHNDEYMIVRADAGYDKVATACWTFRDSVNVYIENIKFILNGGQKSPYHFRFDTHIFVGSYINTPKVTIFNCSFENGWAACSITDSAEVNLKQCTIKKTISGIYMRYDDATVHVVDCVFEECGQDNYKYNTVDTTHGCIYLEFFSDASQIKFKAIGNHFRDNVSCSFQCVSRLSQAEIQSRGIVLRYNMLEGKCPFVGKQEGKRPFFDANIMYNLHWDQIQSLKH